MGKQSSSAVRIGRQACLRVALEPVSSFADKTPQGIWLSENYETIVNARLSGFAWNFASEMEQAAQLDDEAHYMAWANVYARPVQALSISAVLTDYGRPLKWKLLTDRMEIQNVGEEVIWIQYQTRVEESSWHPLFTEAMVKELASGLSRSVKRDSKSAYEIMEFAMADYADGKHICSAEHSPQKIRVGRLRSLNR
jgi:hypothetical protein